MKKSTTSIKEIDKILRGIRGGLTPTKHVLSKPAEQYLQELATDSRLGVQKLIVSLRAHWKKVQGERRRLLKLYEYENKLWKKGTHLVAGIDEAGRGPLAGPVVSAAVILPSTLIIDGLNDSKQTSEVDRERIYEQIMEDARILVGVGMISSQLIDEVNILTATMMSMREAVRKLPQVPRHLLVDGLELKKMEIPQTKIIQGDAKSASIACASIVAKVTRDRLMKQLDLKFPGWNFQKHKGYGTSEHLAAIAKLGPSPIHRLTFAGVKEHC
jgi:ribonuclease HII